MNGLDILTYLRDNGVRVDEELCSVVPDTVLQPLGLTRVGYVVEKLVDDTTGELAHHFADYHNRFPEKTESGEVIQLKRSFQIFIQRILLGEQKTQPSSSYTLTKNTHDVLGQKIEELIDEIRAEWLTWSIGSGYKEMISMMERLLPMLQKKYPNPMLESDAMMMEEGAIDDIIPDEYIVFLYDMMITLIRIYNVKVEQIQHSPNLWAENAGLLNSIHLIAKGFFYNLNWNVFNMALGENQTSIISLAKNVILGINSLYFWIQENENMNTIDKTTTSENEQEKPPEKE